MIKIPTLQELLEAGVHFGHQVRRGNPRMKPFIYGTREGVHIIDLTQSEKYLKSACDFVYNLGKNGGVLLLVGTKKQARPIVKELAQKVGTPYLVERWVGGFFTNFDEIYKNTKKLRELKEQQEKGQLQKYTKKEQLLISRKIEKLERDFAGVADMETPPEAIFVADAVADLTAVIEANKMGVKVVAIADSNCDPRLIDYPVPGNDDAIKSIKILTETVVETYGQGKKESENQKAKDLKAAEEKALKESKEEKVSEAIVQDVAAVEEEVEKAVVKESERVIE